jgi:triacylglycerol lipase
MDEFNFEPKVNEFSFRNALALAKASELAYEAQDDYKKILNEWGFYKVYPLNKHETQGFVAGKDDMILLVFRGTEQTKPEDILMDVLACQENTKLGKVHYGFLTALKFVWKDILKALEEFQDNNQNIWIAGHSLGGALATLAAVKLASKNKCQNISGLYTYGKPRVGDKKFRSEFEKFFKTDAYRITNYKDPVSIIPFSIKLKIFKWTIALQYKHAGKMILFNESGEIAKKEDLCTRATLVGLSVLGVVAATIAKLAKKTKFSKSAAKWVNILTEPHGLEKYKANIRKNIGK